MKRNFQRFIITGLFTVSIISCGDNRIKVKGKTERPASTEKEKVEVDSALQAKVMLLGLATQHLTTIMQKNS